MEDDPRLRDLIHKLGSLDRFEMEDAVKLKHDHMWLTLTKRSLA
jgi:hypothetical protein